MCTESQHTHVSAAKYSRDWPQIGAIHNTYNKLGDTPNGGSADSKTLTTSHHGMDQPDYDVAGARQSGDIAVVIAPSCAPRHLSNRHNMHSNP